MTTQRSLSRKANWRTAAGRRLGYPSCCVKAFVEMAEHRYPSEDQAKAGARTGFIPCLSCTQLVLNGLPIEKLISSQRDPRLKPFPEAQVEDL